MSLPRTALRLLRFRPPAALTTTTTATATTTTTTTTTTRIAIATADFSISAPALLPGRITRDRSRNRGVSAVHRQPRKESVSVRKYPLPQPVLDPEKHTPMKTDDNHGLWGFFDESKSALPTPAQDNKHGRAWGVQELRRKSWEDLHRLWWRCVLERNRLETQTLERDRLGPVYGDVECEGKKEAVKKTMRGIKHTLTERYYSWEEARVKAESDPEINLRGNGPVYTPGSHLEEVPSPKPDGLEPSETAQTPPAQTLPAQTPPAQTPPAQTQAEKSA